VTYFFKLRAGGHIQRCSDGVERRYGPGDVFESTDDLSLLNGRSVQPKFEMIDPGVARLMLQSQERERNETAARRAMDEDAVRQQMERMNPGASAPTADALSSHANVGPALRTTRPNPPRNVAIPGSDDYVRQLEKMSEAELVAHAAEEEVDLKGATKKAEIIKVLRGHK
jgi:hypothetical protein